MADMLPPAVQRFVAEMDSYMEPLDAAMRLVDEFAERNDVAATEAREALATAADAAEKVAESYELALRAAAAYQQGLIDLSAYQEVATQAAKDQADAIAKAAEADIAARIASADLTGQLGDQARAMAEASLWAEQLKGQEYGLTGGMEFAKQQARGLMEVFDFLGAEEKVLAGVTGGLAEADAVLAAGEEVLKNSVNDTTRAMALGAAAAKMLQDTTDKAAGGAAVGAAGRGGGLFGWLGMTLGGVAAWHIALDLIIEGLISIGTAAIAAGVGLAAMYPAANNIYDRLTSMYDVTHALGQNLLPLHGQFDALAHAMAPQVVEAFGGALNLVNGQTGVFAHTAAQVVNIFDTWIAKIDIWARSAGGMGGILHTGVGYLQQFGSILGKVGLALSNILKDDPGIARYLLDLVGAFATLLDWVTKLPGPILTLVLGLHGLWLWGRVLGGIFGRLSLNTLPAFYRGIVNVIGPMLGLTKASGTMAKSFLGLSAVSWAWAAVAAAAIAGVAYESLQADSATKKFIAGINASVSSMSPAQAVYGGLATSIGQLRTQMADVPAEVNKNWNTLGNSLQRVGDRATNMFEGQFHAAQDLLHLNLVGFFGDIAHGLSDSGAKAIEAQNDTNAYRGAIVNLTHDQSNLLQVASALMHGTQAMSTTVGEGTGKLKMLGTTTSEVAHGTYTFQQALALMGVAGVKAGDHLDVMEQKVQSLITGYKALGIQGGILRNSVNAVTFSTELQDSKVSAVTGAWSTFFSTLSGGETGFVGFAQAMQSLDTAISKAHTSMTGLNANSLAARSQFLQTAQSAQTEMNNLTTLSAAAGDGARGTAMLAQANKDLVAQLLPAAQNSSALTTILYGLAQQGGYHGADAFKALSTWVGNTHDPMANLDTIVTKLTGDAGSLTHDVNVLAGALNQNLNQAMAAAIIQADGGQQAFNTFANTIVKNKDDINADIPVARNFAQELIHLTGTTGQAKDEFITFAEKLGLTKQQADRLWASVVRLHGSIGSLHNKYFTITGKGTGVYSISANAATEALLHHATVGAGGTTSKEAHVAAGGIMRGGTPGRDSIPSLLMPGEGVLTTKAVGMIGEHTVHSLNRMAESGAMHALHHFAGGGVAGGGDSGGSISRLSNLPPDVSNHLEASMITSMIAGMNAAASAAQRAAASAGGPAGGRTSAGGPYNVAMLERLWESAGGPSGLARIMAAIALAESGGSPIAHNPSGASGLWQILGQIIPGNIFNPFVNAENAVAKWRTQGLGAWVTYTSGAYREFMDNGGWLKPGTSMVTNNTGKPERVLGPNEEVVVPVTVMLDGQVLFRSVQRSGRAYARRNSLAGPASGSKVFAAGMGGNGRQPVSGGPPQSS